MFFKLTNVRLSHMCVCPTCASVPHVRLSHMCVCPICESVPMHFYESYNFYTSHPRRASKRPPEAAYLRVVLKLIPVSDFDDQSFFILKEWGLFQLEF